MPAFHLLRCMVVLGGDSGTTVYRHRARPIVFPELPILQYLHGEEAITDIAVVGTWETTNDEVLARLNQTYAPEAVQAVFPGNRPRLPLSDASLPRCTLPVYKPRPTRPDNPDPRLKPLDQFTITPDMPVLDPPDLPSEDEPTPDEIAAHAQDDADDMGLADPDAGAGPDGPELPDQMMPRPGDQPHIVRDTLGRGSSRRAGAARAPATLPDVNAGSSHSPAFFAGHRSRP
jgi:hypothetical protein